MKIVARVTGVVLYRPRFFLRLSDDSPRYFAVDNGAPYHLRNVSAPPVTAMGLTASEFAIDFDAPDMEPLPPISLELELDAKKIDWLNFVLEHNQYKIGSYTFTYNSYGKETTIRAQTHGQSTFSGPPND